MLEPNKENTLLVAAKEGVANVTQQEVSAKGVHSSL